MKYARYFILLMLLCQVAIGQTLQESYGYERMWPALKQPWYFQNPKDIAIDSEGYVYIGSEDGYALKKFTAEGEFIRQWIYPQEVPKRLAIDRADNVYVLYVPPSGSAFIRVFAKSGLLIAQWGQNYAEGIGQSTLAVETNGNVYVLDSSYENLQVFSPQGQLLMAWPLPARVDAEGHNQNEFLNLAIDPTGMLYLLYPNLLDYRSVPDAEDYFVVKYDPAGTQVAAWGQFGDEPGQLRKPNDITVDSEGYVYISDVHQVIQKFSSDGQFIDKYGEYAVDSAESLLDQFGPLPTELPSAESIDIADFIEGELGSNLGLVEDTFSELGTLIGEELNAPEMETAINSYANLAGLLGDLTDDSGNNTAAIEQASQQALDDLINGYTNLVDIFGDGPISFSSLRQGQSSLMALPQLASLAELITFINTQQNNPLTGQELVGVTDSILGTNMNLWQSLYDELGMGGTVKPANDSLNWLTADTNSGVELLMYLDGRFIPYGIAINPLDNSIYATHAADNLSKVRQYTATGEFLTEWNNTEGVYVDGSENLRFQAGDIAYYRDGNGQGYIFVSDLFNHRVLKFSETGDYLASFGSNESDVGQLSFPVGLDIDERGILYVVSLGNLAVQKFDISAGQFNYVGTIGGREAALDPAVIEDQQMIMLPTALTTDKNNNIYIVNGMLNTVARYNPDGEMFIRNSEYSGFGANFPEYAVNLVDIAADSQNNTYVAVVLTSGNSVKGQIEKYNASGYFEGYLTAEWIERPASIAIDDNDNLYVYDSHRFLSKYALPTDPFSDCTARPCTTELPPITYWGAAGNYPNQLSFMSTLAVSPDGERVYVAELENSRVQIFRKNLVVAGKAIIIAGSKSTETVITDEGDILWDDTQVGANLAYRAFSYQGFTPQQIRYLTAEKVNFDINGDFQKDNILATPDNVKAAITDWAVNDWQSDIKNLTLYIVDHGAEGAFIVADGVQITAETLNEWVTEWQNQTNGIVTIIYDACYAGSLLDPLLYQDSATGLMYPNRLLIASSQPDRVVTKLPFSKEFFWAHILDGLAIQEAYQLTETALNNLGYAPRMVDTVGMGPLYIGEALQQAPVLNTSDSNLSLANSSATGLRSKAVILAAGSPQQLDYLNLAPKTRQVHEALQQQGHLADDIRMLINVPVEDFSQRTFPADLATLDFVLGNQDTWLQKDLQDFVLYIFGSGDAESIVLNAQESLSFTQLNQYLDKIQTDYIQHEKLVVVHEGYNSGHLLAAMATLPDSDVVNRIVITSHTELPATRLRHELPNFAFSDYFWQQVSTGNYLQIAFTETQNHLGVQALDYTLMLDDNRDGLYQGDGADAANYAIGLGQPLARRVLAGDPTQTHLKLLLPVPTIASQLYTAITPLDAEGRETDWYLIVNFNEVVPFQGWDNLPAWAGTVPNERSLVALDLDFEYDAAFIRLPKAASYKVLHLAVPVGQRIEDVINTQPPVEHSIWLE